MAAVIVLCLLALTVLGWMATGCLANVVRELKKLNEPKGPLPDDVLGECLEELRRISASIRVSLGELAAIEKRATSAAVTGEEALGHCGQMYDHLETVLEYVRDIQHKALAARYTFHSVDAGSDYETNLQTVEYLSRKSPEEFHKIVDQIATDIRSRRPQ